MNTQRFIVKTIWLAIFSVFSLIGGVTGSATAEQPTPATEASILDDASPTATSGAASLPIALAALAPDDNLPGATKLFKYLTVAGTTFRPRQGATTEAYFGTGCIYMTAGSDLIVNTALNLPNGATIKYIRLYYNVTDATNTISAYLTFYSLGQGTNDAVSVSSPSGGPGFGSVLSPKVSIKVSNKNFAYTPIGWPSAALSNVQFCGIRVAYYLP